MLKLGDLYEMIADIVGRLVWHCLLADIGGIEHRRCRPEDWLFFGLC